MKFSSKVLKCGLSPMRKFHPYAVAAEARGKKIYHLTSVSRTSRRPRHISRRCGILTCRCWPMRRRPVSRS